MNATRPKTQVLPLLIAAVLCAGTAQAGSPPTAPDKAALTASQQQAARDEIDRLTRRIEELSRQLADDGDIRVIIRRDLHGMPGMHEDMMHGGSAMAMMGRPGLGVVLAADTAAKGVRIAAVSPDSPAMKAGLHSGDVMLSIDGKTIAGNGVEAVESARSMLDDLKQGQVVRIGYARAGKTGTASVKADTIAPMMAFNRGQFDKIPGMPATPAMPAMPAIPDIDMEIARFGPMKRCAPGNDDCQLPALYEAFRWQGLNLASLDPALGRYFGANKGVLVLSNGPELKGLQVGDVVQRVAGNEVDSPRELMRALRDKDAGSQLKFDVLRDRKALVVAVTVPEVRPLPFMAPPPPPPPPAPPAPPRVPGVPAPPALAAPPPPPPPPPPAATSPML